MIRQLGLMLAAFLAGILIAELLGAISFGVALGVGQVFFAGMLVWILLSG